MRTARKPRVIQMNDPSSSRGEEKLTVLRQFGREAPEWYVSDLRQLRVAHS